MSGDLSSAVPSYTPEELASVITGSASEAVIKKIFNTVVAKRQLDVLERLRTEGPFTIQRHAERRLKIPAIMKLRANTGVQAFRAPVLPALDSFTGEFNISIFKRAIKAYYKQNHVLPYDALYRVYFLERDFAVFPRCFEASFQAFILNKLDGALSKYSAVYSYGSTESVEERQALSVIRKILSYYAKLYSLERVNIYCSDPTLATPMAKSERKQRKQELLSFSAPLAENRYKYPHELLLERLPQYAFINLLYSSFYDSDLSFVKLSASLNPVKTLVLLGVLHAPAGTSAGAPKINMSIFDLRLRDSLIDYMVDEKKVRVQYPYHDVPKWWLNECISFLLSENVMKNLINARYFDVETVFVLAFMNTSDPLHIGSVVDVLTTKFTQTVKTLLPTFSNQLIAVDHTLYKGAKRDKADVFKTMLSAVTKLTRIFLEYLIQDELHIERKNLLSEGDIAKIKPEDIYTAGTTDTFLTALAAQTKAPENVHSVLTIYSLARQLTVLLTAQGMECSKSLSQLSIRQYIEKMRFLTYKESHSRSSVLVLLFRHLEAFASLTRLARDCKPLHDAFLAETRETAAYIDTLTDKFVGDKEAMNKASSFLNARFDNDESVYNLFYVANVHASLFRLCPGKITDGFFSTALRVFLRYGADGSVPIDNAYKTLCSLGAQWQTKLQDIKDPVHTYAHTTYPTRYHITATYPGHIDELTQQYLSGEITRAFPCGDVTSILPMDIAHYVAPPVEPLSYYAGTGYIYKRVACTSGGSVNLSTDASVFLLHVPLKTKPRSSDKDKGPAAPALSNETKQALQQLCHLLYSDRFRPLKTALEHIHRHSDFLALRPDGKSLSPVAEALLLHLESLHRYVTNLLGTLSRVPVYDKCILFNHNKDLTDEQAFALASYASSVIATYSSSHLKELQSIFLQYITSFYNAILAGKDIEDAIVKPMQTLITWNNFSVTLQHKHEQLFDCKTPYFKDSRKNVVVKFNFRGAEAYYKTLAQLPLVHKDLASHTKLSIVKSVMHFAMSKVFSEASLPVHTGKFPNSHREALLGYLGYLTLHSVQDKVVGLLFKGYNTFYGNLHANSQIEKTWISTVSTTSIKLGDFLDVRKAMISYGYTEYLEHLCKVRGPKVFFNDCVQLFYKAVCLTIADRNIDVVQQLSSEAEQYLHQYDPEKPQEKHALQNPEFNNLFGWLILIVECIFTHKILNTDLLGDSKLCMSQERFDDIEKILRVVSSFGETDAAAFNFDSFVGLLRKVFTTKSIAPAYRTGLVMLSVATVAAVHLAPVPPEKSNTDLKPIKQGPIQIEQDSIHIFPGPIHPRPLGEAHSKFLAGPGTNMASNYCCADSAVMLCGAPAPKAMMLRCANAAVPHRRKVAPEQEKKRKKLVRGGRGNQRVFKHTDHLVSILSRFYRAVNIELAATTALLLISGNANQFVSPFISILKASVLSNEDRTTVITVFKSITDKTFSVKSMSMLVKIITLPALLSHPEVPELLAKTVMFTHFDVDLLLIKCLIMHFNEDKSVEMIKTYIEKIRARYDHACAHPDPLAAGDADPDKSDLVPLPKNVESALSYMAIIPTMLNPEIHPDGGNHSSMNDVLPKADIEKYPLMVTVDSKRDAFIKPERIRTLLEATEFLADLKNPFGTGQVAEIQMAWFTNAVAHGFFVQRVMDMAFAFADNYGGENLGYLVPGAKSAEFQYLKSRASIIESASVLCIASMVRSSDMKKEEFAAQRFVNNAKLITESAKKHSDGHRDSCLMVYLDLLSRMAYQRNQTQKRCCDACASGKVPYTKCTLYMDLHFIINVLGQVTDYSMSLTDYNSFRTLKHSLPISYLGKLTELLLSIVQNHEEPGETACLNAMADELAKYTTTVHKLGAGIYIDVSNKSINEAVARSNAPLFTRGLFAIAQDLRDVTSEIASKMTPEERYRLFTYSH